MASPMPSRRHLAAAPSLRPSISAGDPLGFGGEPEPVTARAVCLPSAGTLVHGRSWRISLALASSIALSTSDAFCVTSRSSLAPTCAGRSAWCSRAWFRLLVSNCGSFVLANEETVRRTRGHAFHVKPENPKCARIRTLSSKCVKIWTLSHSGNRSSEVDELELEKLDLDSS